MIRPCQLGGMISGKNRQTPEVLALKARAIELHTVHNYGTTAIAYRIKRNKGLVRKWLVNAGVYRTGCRRRGVKLDGASRASLMRLGHKSHMAKAFAKETAAVAIYDDCAHWCRLHEVVKWRARAYYWRDIDKNRERQRIRALAYYYKGNKNFRLLRVLRRRIYGAIRRQGKYRKAAKTISLVGCSIAELKQYIAARFQPGMTWENYGKWHIDHIKPCALFNLADPEEQKVCFHFSNLQPLWAFDNISKGKRYNQSI